MSEKMNIGEQSVESFDRENLEKNCEGLKNILRTLCMLEKALERLARRNYYSRSQYPEIFIEIEYNLSMIRCWIKKYKIFCNAPAFLESLGSLLALLGETIAELIEECKPNNGKRKAKKSRLAKERKNILRSIIKMNDNLFAIMETLESKTDIGYEIEKILASEFENHRIEFHLIKRKEPLSKRGCKTKIFPWSNRDSYLNIVMNRDRFKKKVIPFIEIFGHIHGHKGFCSGKSRYILRGFRSTPRKPIEKGGEQKEYPIRMVECAECGEKFSLLPSFLPREKHFDIEIIGEILRGVLLSANSALSAMDSSSLTGYRLKSKQTIYNWIEWIGNYHPAAVLNRAGAKGSGYFQEDEGFSKEPNLRTYSVVMADSESLLIWHMDYVDRVDEDSLCDSFEKFAERIGFKALGVTKDKWRASTNALKKVFRGVWIGYCHRHCLKKLYAALLEYQKATRCGDKEINEVYKKFKNVLRTAGSRTALKVRIDMMKEPALDHETVHPVIEEVKKHADR